MIVVYGLLLAISLIGVRFGKNEAYLSREGTTPVKGIFVVIVFFSHFQGYVRLSDHPLDAAFSAVNGCIAQLMVVMFLFYSGYGIFHNILARGETYIKPFLRKRLLPVWLQFAACVVLFLLADIAMGLIGNYTPAQIALAFIGWESVGNSCWFMFITFALYLLTYLSFRFCGGNARRGLIVLSALAVVMAAGLSFFKESWWWNTLLCFPLGMWFRLYKERIDGAMARNRVYAVVLAALTVVFGALWGVQCFVRPLGRGYILLALVFALWVTALTMRVSVGNKVLAFFGRHVFSIYMLQRLPMMVFENMIPNRYVLFIVCFAVTMLLAVAFDFLFGKCRKAFGST